MTAARYRTDIMQLPPNHRSGSRPGELDEFFGAGDWRQAAVALTRTRGRSRFWDRRGGERLLRVLWMGCSLAVILYSVAVLTHVAWMGSIGVRCLFGTKVEEEIPADYAWRVEPASNRRFAAYRSAASRFVTGVIPTTSGRCVA